MFLAAGIGEGFLIEVIFEGVKYLITKTSRKDHYARILKESFRDIAEKLKLEYWADGTLMERIQLQERLVLALQSPDIALDKFLQVLEDVGLSKPSAKRVCLEVNEKFRKTVEKEAAKNPKVFREIIINVSSKTNTSISQVVKDLQLMKTEMPVIVSLISEVKTQLDVVEGKLDRIMSSQLAETTQATSMHARIREILEKVVSIEKMIEKRPIAEQALTLSPKQTEEILASIKSSWLKRFKEPLTSGFNLIVDQHSYKEAQERFTELLRDISKERELHGKDSDFAIGNELNVIEAYCIQGLGLTYDCLEDSAKARELYEKSIFLFKRLSPTPRSLSISYYQLGLLHYKEKEYRRAIDNLQNAVELGLTTSFTVDAHYYLGNSYYFTKQFDVAVKCYDEAIELDPQNAFLYTNRASAYADHGSFEKAIRDYDKAKELDKNLPEAYYGLGTVYFDLRLYQKAISEYSEAIKIFLNYASAYNNRGACYYYLGQVEEAIEDWKTAIEKNPAMADSYINLADVYRTRKQYEKAFEYLNKAIELNPNYACAWYARSWCYFDLRRYDKALEDCDRAAELNPHNTEIHNARGCILLDMGNPERAIEEFNRAIVIDQSNGSAYLNRARAFSMLGKQLDAVNDCIKAIQLDPNDFEAYFRLAFYESKLGKVEESIKEYTKSLELNPSYASAYLNRGFSFYRRKQYSSALDDFNEAIKLDPNNSLAYLDRGNVYYDTDQFDKALDDYNKALELDPDCAMAYYDRGNLRAHYLHQYERSIVDFDKAIALDNTHADAYNSRGVSYFYLADYDKAMENYSKAIELDPSAAVFYRNRGIIYLHRMQTAEALSDFNKAIDLDPNEIESHGGRALVFMIRKDYCSALEESKITGILSVKAGRIDDAIGAFSQGFSLNGVFSNDDTIYCGIFRLVLDPSDYFYLELRNLINRQGMQNEALGAIWTFVLKKLKNEKVNISEIKKMTLQEDLHLLAKYVADM